MKELLSSLSQSMRLESTQKTRTKRHKGLFWPAFPFNLKSQTSIDAAMGWKEWTHAYADIVNLPSMHARYINKKKQSLWRVKENHYILLFWNSWLQVIRTASREDISRTNNW